MQTRNTTSPKLTSILKPAISALALVALLMKLDESASHLTNALCTAEWVAMDLVPHFVAIAMHALGTDSFDHLWASPCPVQMLASHLPLHILLGLT